MADNQRPVAGAEPAHAADERVGIGSGNMLNGYLPARGERCGSFSGTAQIGREHVRDAGGVQPTGQLYRPRFALGRQPRVGALIGTLRMPHEENRFLRRSRCSQRAPAHEHHSRLRHHETIYEPRR